MTQKHALTCGCGTTVAVEVRQAGDRTTCPKCAKTLDVPRLRELKKLDVVEVAGASNRRSSGWSGLPGILFALGLLLLAIAGGSSYYTFAIRSNFESHTSPPADDGRFEHDIQKISLIDSWIEWNKSKAIEISSRRQPYHVFARSVVGRMNKWLRFFTVLATLGLASIVGSFFTRPRFVP